MDRVLSKYRIAQYEIEQLDEEIKRLDELAQSPRIANITGMPRSGKVTDGAEIIAKISDLKAYYCKKRAELLELQMYVESVLDLLEGEERTVLRYKYIDGMRNADIAEKTMYSESTIKRRTKSAMDKLRGEAQK